MKPNIRFNGFSDEWVEKTLGDVYSFSKGSGISKQSILMDESLPKGIPYGDLFTIYNSVIKDVERGTTDINGPVSNGTEILIPASSTVPLGPAQVSAILQSGVRLGGDIIIGKPLNNDLSNIFVAINATANKHKMYRFISGSTISHISASGVASVPIQLPTLPEQQKIGALFSKYDAIIALREQKLEELNAWKKGLLQQMYPKDGAKVPELRFAGFVDDWAEKKLGELAQIAGGKTPSTSDARYWDGGKDWYTPSDLTTIGRRTRGSARTVSEFASLRIWPESTILLSTRAGIGKMAILTKEASINQGLKAILLKKDFDPDFIYSYQPTISKQANRLASGSTFTEISTHDVNKIKLNVPSLPEQQKIGQLFKHLDARISNEQSKIEQLKAQKQGLLQSML